jgi:phosphatidylglycerol:prolipoprotein diacylglycerol transferase
MLTYPVIDPVAIHLGPVQVHWYGIMYLIAFVSAWWLGNKRAQTSTSWDPQQISDLIFYGALGVILGGRLGYILFYDFGAYIDNPLNIFKIWQGGMSFHGGLIGVITAMWVFSRKTGKGFFEIADFVAPLVPIGLGAGRIGNFINGELWGRVTDGPWAMIFPDPRAGGLPRHPSQLYEATLEGLVLFIILWIYSSKPRPRMAVSAMFLICYGIFRFIVEFARMPDAQLGLIMLDRFSMGQLLSLPMILIGLIFLHRAYAYNRSSANSQD